MNGYETAKMVGGGVSTRPQTPLAGVPSALTGVDGMAQDLASTISQLHDRLETAGVLTPGLPHADNAKIDQPPFSSSLANTLDSHRRRLAQMADALREIRDRIDL
jgi:hypothetical protein